MLLLLMAVLGISKMEGLVNGLIATGNRRSDIGLVPTSSWKHEYQKLKRPVGAGLVSPDRRPLGVASLAGVKILYH